MDANASHGHSHLHELPTEGRGLTGLAVSATLHCLAGCAIGEVAGVVIGSPSTGGCSLAARDTRAVHETGIHGGPPAAVVGAVTVAAFVFGLIVLGAEVL